MSLPQRSSQYTIRQLFGFIAVVAVLILLLRMGSTVTNRSTYSVLVFAIPLLLMYCCYTICSHVANLVPSIGKACRIGWLILLILIVLTSYVLWARFRISSYSFSRDHNYPRSFPFPDKILEVYHNHLDITHPVPRDVLKIHAEYPRLQQHLDILALVTIAVTTGVAGVSFPNLSEQITSTVSNLYSLFRRTKT